MRTAFRSGDPGFVEAARVHCPGEIPSDAARRGPCRESSLRPFWCEGKRGKLVVHKLGGLDFTNEADS